LKNLITLVLGASLNAHRYSNKAVFNLSNNGYNIIAIGKTIGFINGVQIFKEIPKNITEIDTVTIYLNPKNQIYYYRDLKRIKPRRVIFNPGAENIELAEIMLKENVEIINGCTLVILNLGQY
tara:strand:+ start:18794 stop:19162 length:369 start_codon:yes stop_codon:yes gene_type:complete